MTPGLSPPLLLICTPTRSGSPELGIHRNFVDESFMGVVELTLPTHAAELAQGTGGVHLWYDVERSVQRSKTLRSPCSCYSGNICTMRTRIQNDIQSKPYSLSRCSETASSISTVWASKPLRISSNSLLQAAGDGAVEAALLEDSPSKTTGETTGLCFSENHLEISTTQASLLLVQGEADFQSLVLKAGILCC